jgi:hypothetical protein
LKFCLEFAGHRAIYRRLHALATTGGRELSATLTLIDLAGSIALLLWGVLGVSRTTSGAHPADGGSDPFDPEDVD